MKQKQPIGKFSALLRRYGGIGSWYFLHLPKKLSKDLANITESNKRPFRSVKVFCEAKNGVSKDVVSWETSVFYDKKRGTYLLPVKKEIRTKLSIDDKSLVSTRISLL